jgi:hypothetical protein
VLSLTFSRTFSKSEAPSASFEYNFRRTWTEITSCSLNDLMTLPVDDSSDEENEEDDTGGPEEDGSEGGDE